MNDHPAEPMAEQAVALTGLADLYRDLHAHPELSFQELRTAGIVADVLSEQGYDVTGGVGGTGVVGVLRNGRGPTVLLRADMDALPVAEDTGLPYASTVRGIDSDGNDVPVMHACGHDMHVVCLLGAADRLAAERDAWSGTVVAVFQPAEEIGAGAQAMIDDGFLDRFPRPDICLGQHVVPIPAGYVGLRAGPTMAAADSLRVVLHGRGGHGSMPHATVDPVVMAASTVLRLQGIVAREVDPKDSAVLTVGSLQAGSKENIIPDRAELKLNVRTYTEHVRTRVLAAITRVVEAEATASGAPRPPEITELNSFPLTSNDETATHRVRAALTDGLGADRVLELPPAQGSEDFGTFGTSAGVPSVFWFTGGVDPAETARFLEAMAAGSLPEGTPGNHSPQYAPCIEPAIETGVRALRAGAMAWLGGGPA
ncbi:MAG: amidohydrolase [Pseudonocardia sp.]|nr:amidohydrolase [Pseudonocardia sp.]